jgi:magnesium-transporting ATPase (P-type)
MFKGYVLVMGPPTSTMVKRDPFKVKDDDKTRDAGSGLYMPQLQKAGGHTMKLIHMTYIFQSFVFMQIFNQLNARLLTPSFNIFEGICRNWLFIAVALSTFVIQMAMVEVGGKITKTFPLAMW